MKRSLTFIGLVMIAMLARAQNVNPEASQVDAKSDSAQYIKWRSQLAKQIKVDKLVNATDVFHFRFWQDGQAVDIWTSDYKVFQGSVTNFARRSYPAPTKRQRTKPPKYFIKHIKLDTAQAHQVYGLILQYSILSMPESKKIEGWTSYADGDGYNFEISSQNQYRFMYFGNPAAQKNIPEAVKVQDFIQKINAILKLQALYAKLIEELPYGCFTTEGNIVFYGAAVWEDEYDFESEFDNDYWAQ